MKNMKNIWILLIILAACQKSDPAPDPRGPSIGDYSYHVTVYTLNNGALEFLPGQEYTGTFSVISSTTDSHGIKFIENGVTSFTGVNVASSSDGYTFNVLPISTKSGGDTFVYTPYKGPAQYIKAKKSFRFYMQSLPVVIYLDISK